MYAVVWVGGENDGKILGEFDDLGEAANFARSFYQQHENEFNPVYGGVAILDEDNNEIEY